MKSNAFKDFLIFYKSYWSSSRPMVISIIMQVLIGLFVIITAATEQTVDISRLGLGFAMLSMAFAQYTFLRSITGELKKLEFEEDKFELEQLQYKVTLSNFAAIAKKLNTIEEHITKRKRKER